MGGPYSALTKNELPNGDVIIKDTINGTSERMTKDEYEKGAPGSIWRKEYDKKHKR